jgi:hypothetical protein
LAAFLLRLKLTAGHGVVLLQPVATSLVVSALFRLSAKLRREGD